MNRLRGYTVAEMMVVCAIVALLAAMLMIPAYDRYRRAREVNDAAAVLAQDIAFLERFAQNSDPYEGATIEVESSNPLRYTGYSGRPSGLDPQSRIRGVLLTRAYDQVALAGGPLRKDSPLLFAHNGSVQYVVNNQWADQHLAVTIELTSLADRGRAASVSLDPFTGAASAP